jgi:hypothetical protein
MAVRRIWRRGPSWPDESYRRRFFASKWLGHAGRLAAHRGHSDGSLFDTLVGLAIMWFFLRVCWALARGLTS